jgi:hypothetical protein
VNSLLLVFFSGALAAQSVSVRGGNIVYTDSHGAERQLTKSGRDREPSLSPDGRLVVFARETDQTSLSMGGVRIKANELWIISASGNKLERVLAPPKTINGGEYSNFSSPKFAPDNNAIYFLVQKWATSFELERLSLTDQTLRTVTHAIEFKVVAEGRWKGHLIVQQRRFSVRGYNYYWYWLYDTDGTEDGLIGQTMEEVKAFLAETLR